VEIIPGKEGLLHISEVAWERTANINDVLKLGDVVDVKLKKISSPGRFELSIKDLLKKPEGYKESEDRRPERPRSGGFQSRNSRPRDRH